ncbi:MAG: hypothetical protein R3332_08140 [Pseudohongiellaceae bacterium]|nr:hypothetical protein [Pseudohongiellaceae bacterium]
MDKTKHLISLLFLAWALLFSSLVLAEQALLVDEGILVEVDPDPEEPAFRANYVSEDGWAITGQNFIDAVVMVFDFGDRQSVASATLSLPLEEFIPNGSEVILELVSYPDDGIIDIYDYTSSNLIPVSAFNPLIMSGYDPSATLTFDVTGAVNANLPSSRYVAFRIKNTINPEDVNDGFPGYSGVKFQPLYTLEFIEGEPSLPGDRPRFNGSLLSVPEIVVPGLGVFDVEMGLINASTGLFSLQSAVDVTPGGVVSGSGRTGMELLSCDEFTAPSAAQSLAPGKPSLDLASGRLSIPSVIYDDIEYTLELQFIDGTSPLLFGFVSLEEATDDGATIDIGQFGGSLVTEPTQDFIPLCNGWVLIGDTTNNTLVERNVVTGETGAIYSSNLDTKPNELLLDEENGLVYLNTHPETERLYKMDYSTGEFSYYHLEYQFSDFFSRHFSPRDIALGEDGNLFIYLFDRRYVKEAGDPPAKHGRWMGLFNNIGEPLAEPIPMLLPERIEYDPVGRNVIMATESNLVTFLFDPDTQTSTPAFGTDIVVGAGCTDLSISPDGVRLAFSCIDGNELTPHTSIVDMDPVDYLNADGEWLLEAGPVSATFTNDSEMLIATDNQKLYFFDAESHVLLESYNLGLEEGESVKKVRVSRDGGFVLLLMEADISDTASKINWLPLPTFAP